MPEAKVDGSRQVDRENETRRPATGQDQPVSLETLLLNLDDQLERIAVQVLNFYEDNPSAVRAVVERVDAWKRAMIEAQGRSWRGSSADDQAKDTVDVSVAALAEEMATYRRCLPELLREHEGKFVLIKGTEVAGIFPDRSAGLREGYRRFGIVPLLVRQIAASDPAVYLPNISLSDDLQRLLRRKVESGQFPSEEAVIEKALRLFLIEGPDEGHSRANRATEPQKERLPGPFIEEETVVPEDIPRTGREVSCLFLHDVTRQPDLFPGD